MKESLITWLREHSFIHLSTLEAQCDIPKGVLVKAVSENNPVFLHSKFVPELVEVLENYGFRKN